MAAVYKSLSKGEKGNNDKSATKGPVKKNKQRVLILSSRGVTFRHRHLLNDIATMLPHGRRESKFDSKKKLSDLNELAELYNCNNVMFFEARKHQDLYMFLSKVPNGPTVKFHVQNIHTMDELHFLGNCLKGSRPILSFDAAFEQEPHLKLMKQLFLQTFGVPEQAKRSKPFIDHVMGFSLLDNRIWVRNYQINEEEAGAETDMRLIEIGPRFCLMPISIQEGSFGGPIIYQNRQFVSPNQVRAEIRQRKASRHNGRTRQDMERTAKKDELGIASHSSNKAANPLDTKNLFA